MNIATASLDARARSAKTYCDEKDGAPNYFELSGCEAECVYENVKRHIEIFNMQ